jgi:hypothetical protein
VEFLAASTASARSDSHRQRAFIAAVTPFALVVVLTLVVTTLHPHIRWKWEMWWKPLQLSGMWFGGLAAPAVGWDAIHGVVYPIAGWVVVLAWCWAVRHTRLGNLGWGTHCAISLLWVFAAFVCFAYAVRGI